MNVILFMWKMVEWSAMLNQSLLETSPSKTLTAIIRRLCTTVNIPFININSLVSCLLEMSSRGWQRALLFISGNSGRTLRIRRKFLRHMNQGIWHLQDTWRTRRKQWLNYLTSLFKWMADQVLGVITKRQFLLKAKNNRK